MAGSQIELGLSPLTKAMPQPKPPLTLHRHLQNHQQEPLPPQSSTLRRRHCRQTRTPGIYAKDLVETATYASRPPDGVRLQRCLHRLA